ncbi:antitermination protein NusG [Candidatus Vondammii sp. HM_W22]|uniref:antitermination protein NusG n=1 Tax=Candidatus Vondammii sp. HM_W22 TaxID=2687299 RepID=UPI001F136F73|nr:antitermination protein NusG [Candidatus Vondammii sp. HM_W22]
MFLKLLLTALVIAGALLALRRRREKILRPAPAPRTVSPEKRNSRLITFTAVSVVILMLLGAGFYLFHQWRDTYQIITIHVIDARSGNETTYRAYKGDVDGRSFQTTDGRRVTLAEVERLEMGGD